LTGFRQETAEKTREISGIYGAVLTFELRGKLITTPRGAFRPVASSPYGEKGGGG